MGGDFSSQPTSLWNSATDFRSESNLSTEASQETFPIYKELYNIHLIWVAL